MDDSNVDDLPLPLLMEVSDDDDHNQDNEEELEMVNMVAQLEKSWEPARRGAPDQEAIDDHPDTNNLPPLMEVSDDSDKDEKEQGALHQAVDHLAVKEGHAQLECKPNQFIIRDGYGVWPAVTIWYNNKHPSAQAGQPLTHEESRDSTYCAALGSGNNSWAPFNSKKDWEITRWAKLQGAGSTAFSELLAINVMSFTGN
jgi:hypothetical protein